MRALLQAASIVALAALASSPVAAIECDGNFQVQKGGNRIATPYCQDGNLARVAREYGTRVSAGDIRANPGVKGTLCRFIGDDNRVRDTCNNYRDLRPSAR